MKKLSHLRGEHRSGRDKPAYLAYFGLTQIPFTEIAPPKTVTPVMDVNAIVREVNLEITASGLSVISGDDEESKASIIQHTVEGLDSNVPVARFRKAPERPCQFLAQVLEKFGFEPFQSALPQYRNVLAAFLSHTSQTNEVAVILIEQTEKVSDEVLNEIARFMRNQSLRSGIHVIFVGQPGSEKRVQEAFVNLNCRSFALARTKSVNVADYVFGYLNAAGLPGRKLFTPPAIRFIADLSKGDTAVINRICQSALEAAAAAGFKKINKHVLEEATRSFEPPAGDASDKPVMKVVRPVSELFSKQRRHSSLIMTRNGKRISRFELTRPRLLMGRHKSNDIYIPRPGISLFHAVLVTEGRDVYLFDLRSTNGTTINGQEVSKRKLVEGDVIWFGALSLKFCQGSNGISDMSEDSALPGFTETVVLEDSDSADPTVYLQSTL